MMRGNPATLGKNAAFVLSVISSGFILLFCAWYRDETGIWIGLVALTVLTFSLTARVRFDLVHPTVWFGLGFWLYSISSPVLYLLDYEFGPAREPASRVHALILEYLALATFGLIVGTAVPKFRFRPTADLHALARGNTLFMAFSFGMSLAYLWAFQRFGVTSKFEKSFSASYLLRSDFFYTFMMVGFCVYAVSTTCHRRPVSRKWTLLFAGYLVLSFFVSGERDLVFRFALTYALLHVTIIGAVKRRHLYSLLVVALALSTLMAQFKNIILVDTAARETVLERSKESISDIPVLFLGSEFRTAGDNLSLLVDWVPDSIPHFLGKSTWWETLSVLNLGFIRGRGETPSTATWFTINFYDDFYHIGGGMGFTLVGQGYLDFGVLGVIALFAGLAVLVRKLYRHSATNAVYFIFYVNLAPMILYSVRGTTATILSPMLKHILLPLVVMFVLGWRSKKMRPRERTPPATTTGLGLP